MWRLGYEGICITFMETKRVNKWCKYYKYAECTNDQKKVSSSAVA